MMIDELVKKVEDVSLETNYWFVRTDYGNFFETFYENSFIAIGWNEVSLEELRNDGLKNVVKDKISRIENLDLEKSSSKGTVTAVYNKLKRFTYLKKGDIIIIPSKNSSRYAFGIVEDSNAYNNFDSEFGCDYIKRKKIKWICVKPVSQLNPVFYQIKSSRHSLSEIRGYETYIDNVLNNIYFKDGNAHFVLDIKTQNDINVNSLISLIENIQKLSEEINIHFHLDEIIKDNSIRLNLNSPGKIEFKLPKGKTLVTLAAILSLASCRENNINGNNPELTNFVEIHNDTLNQITKSMNDLEVDRERINSFN